MTALTSKLTTALLRQQAKHTNDSLPRNPKSVTNKVQSMPLKENRNRVQAKDKYPSDKYPVVVAPAGEFAAFYL